MKEELTINEGYLLSLHRIWISKLTSKLPVHRIKSNLIISYALYNIPRNNIPLPIVSSETVTEQAKRYLFFFSSI